MSEQTLSMERRYLLFIVLSLAIFVSTLSLRRWIAGPPRQQAAAPAAGADQGAPNQGAADQAQPPGEQGQPAQDKPDGEKGPVDAGPGKADQAVAGGDAKPAEAHLIAGQAPNAAAAAAPEPEETFVTLGSLAVNDPFRMLATLTNRGAAVTRVELSSPRFREGDTHTGYLGHLAVVPTANGDGVRVRLVGRGTPAAQAGLRVDDAITKIAGQQILDEDAIQRQLALTRPGDQLAIGVRRDGRDLELSATLTRHPLAVIRPEVSSPASFRMTFDQIDGAKIEDKVEEMAGVSLLNSTWEVVADDEMHVEFRKTLPEMQLEVHKTFTIAEVPANERENSSFPAYHLDLKIEVKNTGPAPRKFAYRLDGPNGLPTEAWWYATKIGEEWGAMGARDVSLGVLTSWGVNAEQLSCASIIDAKKSALWLEAMKYAGVDAQYFASAIVRTEPEGRRDWPGKTEALQVGPIPQDPKRRRLTNVSVRVTSPITSVAAGQSAVDEVRLFAGPKRPDLLAAYGLEKLVSYGWFGFVSRPMLWLLHTFYAIVRNYGLAIIMLTVLVRLCMFPLSRKQALNAQKMQELQPEMKQLAEKYKNNLEARGRAQQELFKKHNFHPLAGCVPALIQLPIFLGLYRSLSVDVELRQAPLFSEAIRWCSDLGAPDMLFRWDNFLPKFLADETGWLGPYFNVLPCITIALFLIQSKLFMPPPADEQAAMQQNVMKWMMVVMGVMFFKVPSGLCLYFIASSLWGIAERMILPKTLAAAKTEGGETSASALVPARSAASSNGHSGKAARRAQRGRK